MAAKHRSDVALPCLHAGHICVLGHVCFVGLLGCVNRRRAVSPGAERLSAHACAQVHGGVFVPHDQVHESLAFTRFVRAGRPHSRWHDKPTTSPWSHSGGKCIPAILSRCDVRDDELSVANLMLPRRLARSQDVCSTPMLQYSPESGFSLLAASEHAK